MLFFRIRTPTDCDVFSEMSSGKFIDAGFIVNGSGKILCSFDERGEIKGRAWTPITHPSYLVFKSHMTFGFCTPYIVSLTAAHPSYLVLEVHLTIGLCTPFHTIRCSGLVRISPVMSHEWPVF